MELVPGHRQEIMVEGGAASAIGVRQGGPLQGFDRAGPVAGPIAGHAQGIPRGLVIGRDPDRFLGQGQRPDSSRAVEVARFSGQEPGQVVQGVRPMVAIFDIPGVVGRQEISQRSSASCRSSIASERPPGLGQGAAQTIPGDRQVAKVVVVRRIRPPAHRG